MRPGWEKYPRKFEQEALIADAEGSPTRTASTLPHFRSACSLRISRGSMRTGISDPREGTAAAGSMRRQRSCPLTMSHRPLKGKQPGPRGKVAGGSPGTRCTRESFQDSREETETAQAEAGTESYRGMAFISLFRVCLFFFLISFCLKD